MTEPSSCSTCGAPIPGGSPGGACPRCLMAVGFATDAGILPPDVKPAQVEQRFPAYEVRDPLGQGGMGVVFRARQKALDREVALKVLPAVPGRGTEFADRFQREARALARLQHPGIVQVFDFGVSADGWCYLAMELVEGANLRRSLSQGRLTPREALAIVPQICDALQYAHDQGVVHRDIKPENVLLAKDGRVKIADFGLAKLVQGTREPSLTGTGHVMGTPHYMAPEQLEHPGDVDHRADIYSLGVVFYEMLTGELPLGRFPPPSRRSDVDARIDEIVLRTLEKEREARFQRVSEIRTSIAAASVASPPPLDRVDVPTPAPYPLPSPPRGKPDRKEPLGPPPKLSRLAAASALAPLGVALVAFAAWYANQGTQFETRLAVASVWAAGAVFAAMVAGVAAWAHVRHSGGKLYGRRFALLAMVLSPIAAFVPSPFVACEYESPWRARRAATPVIAYGGSLPVRDDQTYTTVSPDGSGRAVRYVDGHEVPLHAQDEELGVLAHGPAIRDLVERAQKVWPSASQGLLAGLYPAADLTFLRQLEPEIVEERKQAGTMGLPLASKQLLGNTLQAFRVEDVEVDRDRTNGAVVVTDGRHRVRAGVTREWNRWVFKFTPVEVLPEATPATDAPQPETGDAPPAPEASPEDDELPPPAEVPPPESR